jgi:RecA/RadA recombinase
VNEVEGVFPLNLKKITLIAGHFGSGKTEIAVNLALQNGQAGVATRLLDLDIVNPYFRSFEAKKQLEAAGVDLLVSSMGGYADVPAIPGDVASIFTKNETKEIVDLGGDPDGVRLLGMYERQLNNADFDFFFVFNANRPETGSIEKGLRYFENIEFMSKQKFSALINNTHMIDETEIDDVLRGQDIALKIADKVGLPLLFNAMTRKIYEKMQSDQAVLARLKAPAFIIDLQMKKPWEV